MKMSAWYICEVTSNVDDTLKCIDDIEEEDVINIVEYHFNAPTLSAQF